jgi:hypothetical protein
LAVPIFIAMAMLGAIAGCQHAGTSRSLQPSEEYLAFSFKACDVVETNLPEVERVAEIVAQRHLNGGLIGFPWNGQGLQQELMGRSGGIVHAGFERPFKKDRTGVEKTNDVAIISWERAPADGALKPLEDLKKRGCYIIGFGPRKMAALAPFVALCDAWFDTGFEDDDRVVRLDDGSMVGRGNCLLNTMHGWALTAEIVSALTRHGKMPTMWKAYLYDDGREWGNCYLGLKQFHDDFQIAPIAQRKLAKEYVRQIRAHLKRFQTTQLPSVDRAASLIATELRGGGKLVVTAMGHMPWTFVAKYEDAQWAEPHDLHYNTPHQVEDYLKKTPNGGLILRLGYSGIHPEDAAIFKRKNQRVVLITATDTHPGWEVPNDMTAVIDMGWAFGDACVAIPNYPIKLFPPSGVMQLVAYECVNVEVLSRLMGQ